LLKSDIFICIFIAFYQALHARIAPPLHHPIEHPHTGRFASCIHSGCDRPLSLLVKR
jgi:hypothetical protein